MNSLSENSKSRENIFRRLRAVLPESVPLPDLPATGPWQCFDDPVARFREVLTSVGGHLMTVPSLAAADQELRSMNEWKSAAVRCSVVAGVGDSSIDLNHIDDPHQLENVGFAVLSGHFGVAENAAIWVTDDTVRHRVLYFIPQHLAIVVPAGQIVHNMHEAYTRINPAKHRFSGFISGPSKTADIEQSLVIGAHGARSLVVFLVDGLK
jgi:L-lactate dehydrogenase complex protein LldG